MSTLINALYDLGPWAWFILAVVLFALEVMLPGLHFIWFGAAAGMVGVLTLATGMPWSWQLIAFAVISAATVYWMRRYTRRDSVASDEPALNVRGQQYVGRTVMVEDAIREGRGKVRVGDTLWAAEGPDAAAGTTVKVKGTNGIVLIVAPVVS